MDLALLSSRRTRLSWRTTARKCLSAAARMLMPHGWQRRPNPPAWADTLPSSPPEQAPPRAVPSPAAELTRVLNKFPDGRAALRHLHIVEQTLHMRQGNLDLVPTPVLTKAMLQLRFLMSGPRRRPGLERLQLLIQQQLFRAEMRQFVDSTRGAINWQGTHRSDTDSELGELCTGEIVDTSLLPLAFQATTPLGLGQDHAPGARKPHRPPSATQPHRYTQQDLSEAELAQLRTEQRHE